MSTWRDRALCRTGGADPELFFPAPTELSKLTTARQWCARCPVTGEGLAYATEHDERYGVWGGKSAYQRARMAGREAS